MGFTLLLLIYIMLWKWSPVYVLRGQYYPKCWWTLLGPLHSMNCHLYTCFNGYVRLLWMILNLLWIKFLHDPKHTKQLKTTLPWTKGIQTKHNPIFKIFYPTPRTREQQHVLHSLHRASATMRINSYSKTPDSSNNETFIN